MSELTKEQKDAAEIYRLGLIEQLKQKEAK